MASTPGDPAIPPPGQPPLWFEGDILVLRMDGQFGVAEMQMLIDMGEVLFAQYGYILLLADAKHTSGLHPDARKLQAEQLKRVIRPNHTAIYHVNTAIRLMSTLAQRGIEIITGKSYTVTFHKDEAEARAEIAKQRAVLQKTAVRPR